MAFKATRCCLIILSFYLLGVGIKWGIDNIRDIWIMRILKEWIFDQTILRVKREVNFLEKALFICALVIVVIANSFAIRT